MCIRDSIGAGHEQEIGIDDVGDRVGHCPGTERRGQTGHAAAVSETGAVVDVVRPDHRAGELLDEVVLLVGAFGRDEEGDAVGAMCVPNGPQPAGHVVEGGVPGRRVPGGKGIAPVVAQQGRGQPVGGCLLYTSPSPRDRTRSRMPSSA